MRQTISREPERTLGLFPVSFFLDIFEVGASVIVSLGLIILMLIMPTSLSKAYSKENPNPSESIAFPKKSLKTIIVPDYYPLSFVNDTGAPDGFSVDLIKAVALVMGLKVEIGVDTWENAKKALEKGTIIFLPMMASSSERSQLFDSSVPHTIAYDAVFVRKDPQKLSHLETYRTNRSLS